MTTITPYVGQRLSLKNQTCIVRYIGPVADKQGSWLGVEWDDPSRGKNNGTHDGVTYFECRSQSPTAASFLRPKQTWDSTRTFLQALREKYISPEEATNAEIVYISGKHAEEVGLEKFAKRQAQLQGIHTLVLDRMCIRHEAINEDSDQAVTSLCGNITSLDLGGNLFETFDEILRLCQLFPKLRTLTLNGNRFSLAEDAKPQVSLPGVRYLNLTDTLLTPVEIAIATSAFPSLETLLLENNNLSEWTTSRPLPPTVHTLDLSNNNITNPDSLGALFSLPNLLTLHLKKNKIGTTPTAPTPHLLSRTLQTLDLRHNSISTWTLPNTLPTLFPSLHNLLIASNPLYLNLTTPSPNNNSSTKPLTPEDGYMLTLARLPHLHTLNHSTITDKERLNAETYYLGLIAREIAPLAPKDRELALAEHPRWAELCDEYGEPAALAAGSKNNDDVNPASLAARMVEVTFHVAASARRDGEQPSQEPMVWTEDVPRSASMYTLLGRVGRKLDALPLALRLVWETGERDPVRSAAGGEEGPVWWDSEDEEEEGDGGGTEWVAREVELAAGTRMVGTYFEGRKARVRVEVRSG
ncbi:hypothetical protein Q7P37_001245 [Cladosporium fusiforme]